jgi:hypothetical protein
MIVNIYILYYYIIIIYIYIYYIYILYRNGMIFDLDAKTGVNAICVVTGVLTWMYF